MNPFEFTPGVRHRQDSQDADPANGTPPAGAPGRKKQAATATPEEVDELKKRLAELEKIVANLAPKKSPRSR
jgi:hypothetical protein